MSDDPDKRVIRDRLLRTITSCAQRLGETRQGVLPLLRQAAALHWRLHPASKPLMPDEVEERLSWPIEAWLDSSIRSDYAGALYVGGFPSPTCLDIMLEVNEVTVAESVQNVVKRVRNTCRLRDGGEDLYRRFRQYIIEHPIVDDDVSLHELLVPLGVDVRELYMPVPQHLRHRNQIYPCPVCGWPLNLNGPVVTCQSTWCLTKAGSYSWSHGVLLHNGSGKPAACRAANDAMMLQPPIWKFTLVPGLLELSLARRIAAIGLEPRLWPDVDAADVQVVVHEEVVDIDAKVWRSLRHLAAHLKSMAAPSPRWIVIPDFMKQHVGYLREQVPPSIRLFTELGCIKELKHLCAP